MGDELFPGLDGGGAGPAPVRQRGRPKGSTGKKSSDLLRYIEAHYGGLTPGQQLAAVGLVSAREVKAAGKVARKAKLDPVVVAMTLKAKALAELLGVELGVAWGMMREATVDLMPYVHQKRPLAIDHNNPDGKLQPLIYLPEPASVAAPMGATVLPHEAEEFQLLIEGEATEVSKP